MYETELAIIEDIKERILNVSNLIS